MRSGCVTQLDCLIKFYLDFTKQNKKAMIKFTPAAQYLQRSSRAVTATEKPLFADMKPIYC